MGRSVLRPYMFGQTIIGRGIRREQITEKTKRRDAERRRETRRFLRRGEVKSPPEIVSDYWAVSLSCDTEDAGGGSVLKRLGCGR